MERMQPMKPMKAMHFEQMERWWPENLGKPNASGSQNDVQYAYFAKVRRLLLRDGASVSTYDTGDHVIQGISQASDAAHATLTSNQGTVELSDLKRL